MNLGSCLLRILSSCIYIYAITVEEAKLLKVLPVQFRLHGTLPEVKLALSKEGRSS